MATGITTGKRLKQSKAMLSGVPQGNDSIHAALMAGIRAEAEEKARNEAGSQSYIKELEARARAADATLTAAKSMRQSANEEIETATQLMNAAIVSRETAEKKIAQMEARHDAKITELTAQMERLRDENIGLYSKKSDKLKTAEKKTKEVNSQVRKLEQQVSNLQGQLEQARAIKPAKPSKVINQTTPAIIPSFDVVPVRDAAGNLIGATVNPIGGK